VRLAPADRCKSPPKEGIHRKQSRAEDQDQERGKPVGVGCGAVKVFWLGEDVKEVGAVVGDAEVSHCHVYEEHERRKTRRNAAGKQAAPDKLHERNKHSGCTWRWQVEAGEELRYTIEMRQFSPAVLDKLPAPVEAYGEQKWALQMAHQRGKRVRNLRNPLNNTLHGSDEYDWYRPRGHERATQLHPSFEVQPTIDFIPGKIRSFG